MRSFLVASLYGVVLSGCVLDWDGSRPVPPADRGVDAPVDAPRADAGPGEVVAYPDALPPDAFAAPGTWVTVKPGSFTMGSPDAEPCRPGPDAGIYPPPETQHQVTLTHAFEITTLEVTQLQYKAVMKHNPSYYWTLPAGPVESVSWHEAAGYCNALSQGLGLVRCYTNFGSGSTCSENDTSLCQPDEICILHLGQCTRYAAATQFSGSKIYTCPGYRLPTEAEWEYAYRAGTKTPFYNGPNSPATCYKCQSLKDATADNMAWYCYNADEPKVGGKPKSPNAWGLYNMAGNVQEWCHDWFQVDLGSAAVTDPVGPSKGTDRVIRGGSFYHEPADLRAASRFSLPPASDYYHLGLRCVRTVK